MFLHSRLERLARDRVALHLDIERYAIRLFHRCLDEPEPFLEILRLVEAFLHKRVQVDSAESHPISVFFLLVGQFDEERLGLFVHFRASRSADGGVHHAAKESGLLTRFAETFEDEGKLQKILHLFVVLRSDFLERRMELKLALLEDQTCVHLRKHLVQRFQSAMVLILQSLIQLMVPMKPPRALEIFPKLSLKVREDKTQLLHRTLPCLLLPHEIHCKQRSHFFSDCAVPLAKATILISQNARDILQLTDVRLQCHRVVPCDHLPEPVFWIGEYALELHSVVKHHGLLARDHFRRNVVVEICHLAEDHAVSVKLPRRLRLRGDIAPDSETERGELSHLAQQTDEFRVVVQLDVSGA